MGVLRLNIKKWIIATRPWAFPMTIITVSIGGVYALYENGAFNIVLYLLTIIGTILLHASVNVYNDYYDTLSGVDRRGAPTTKYRPHPIIEGLIPSNQLFLMATISMVIALLIGLYLALVVGWLAIILGGLGGFLAFEYTGPPLYLKYRGLGELSVFLAWGPLMVLGSYYVISGGLLSINPILISIPTALLVVAVLMANNIRDIEYDESVNVRTLQVRIGREKSIKLYIITILLAYITVIIEILLRILPLLTLLVFITLPKALKLIRLFRREIPDAADPLTAQLLILFGITYIISLLISIIL